MAAPPQAYIKGQGLMPSRFQAEVANPQHPKRHVRLRFLVDSGAVYSVIPAAQLEKLGIKPTGERTFFLANGQPVRRRTGEARITYEGQTATCVVLFGDEGDSTLLGVTTLENLGLIFDPLRQKIMSLPMLLAEARKYFA
jgi:clan AA aspartic protease